MTLFNCVSLLIVIVTNIIYLVTWTLCHHWMVTCKLVSLLDGDTQVCLAIQCYLIS